MAPLDTALRVQATGVQRQCYGNVVVESGQHEGNDDACSPQAYYHLPSYDFVPHGWR